MRVTTSDTETVKDDVWIPTTCLMCYNNCSIKVHRVNGVVVKIEGNSDSPQNAEKICAKGLSGIMSLYSPNRITAPLKRTNPEKGIGVDPKWQEISWDEAINIATERLRKSREKDPRKLVIQSFDRVNTSSFRTYMAFGSAYGTPNTHTAGASSYYCGNNLHPIGYLTNAAFHFEPDVHHCNYLILIGAQHGFMAGEDATASTGRTADARMRGMKVVVVDPICTAAAAKADDWLPIRPGTDSAFALGIINVLLNEVGIYDAPYLKKYTNAPYLIAPDGHYLRDEATKKPLIWDAKDGKAKTYDDPSLKDFALEGKYKVAGADATPSFQLLKEHVKKYTCEEVEKITTIPAETTRRIAKEFGEAARIGSTIVIDGKELPCRPACVYWRKGANQHKHSMLTGMAIQLMNMLIGAIDVPGGMIAMNSRLLPGKVNDWSYGPKEGPDGLLVPEHFRKTGYPYPVREVKPPADSVSLLELFPLAAYSTTMWDLVVIDPKKYKLPYEPDIMIHSWTNMLASTIDPKQEAEVFKKFFQISFALEIDETTEFADVVFPDTHYLETLNPALEPSREIAWAKSEENGLGYWSFQLRQPVVAPPPGVRSSFDVLLEISEGLGILKDVYHFINVLHRFREPYKLDLDKKYTWPEIVDIWAKSWFGPEHDLAWFKEHSFISFPQALEEVYTTPFDKPRIPIYFEHYIKAGKDVKRVTEEVGIKGWDVSDYQALPDWKPCPAYEEHAEGYDLYPVNFRSPFHNMTQTANNVWLNELGEYNPYAYYVQINSQVARKKGLKDGDMVRLQTEEGRHVEGLVKVTNCVHPEVVGIAGSWGHWAKGLSVARGKGIHYNRLIPNTLERIDMLSSALDICVKVKVSKINEVQK